MTNAAADTSADRSHDPEAAAVASVIDVLKRRASVRSFEDRDVPEDMIRTILDAARQAPTSSNLHAYSVIVVRDPATKARLAALAGDQAHVAKAPVFLALCADINRLDLVAQEAGDKLARDHLEMSLVAMIDAALVGMSATLAADSLGLGGCMIGGMRNDPLAVAETLGLPDGVFVVFGLTMGWPIERPPAKPRMPDDLMVHWETYQTTDAAQVIGRYDPILEAHKERTDRADGVTWSQRITNGFSKPKRLGLAKVLKQLGFGLD